MASVGSAQSFDENEYYQLRAHHSGKCVDIANFSQVNGGLLQQWDCAFDQPQHPVQANQLWRVVDTGSGSYRIVSAMTAKCMDVANASTANGALMQQYDCSLYGPQWNQSYTFTSVGGGFYRVQTTLGGVTNKCLDVAGVSTANGASIQQYDCNFLGQQNQEWMFVPVTPRTPLSHLQFLQYFVAPVTVQQMSHVVDHVGSASYDIHDTQGPALTNIYRATMAGLKIDFSIFDDLVIWLPNCDPDHGDNNCDGVPNRYDGQGNLIDGGLRADYASYFTNTIKPAILPYVQAGVVRSFTLPGEFGNLYGLNFSFAQINNFEHLLGGLVKNDPDFHNIPVQVLNGAGAGFFSHPAEIDWVAFDEYFDSDANYRATLNAVKNTLLANQSIVLYPETYVERTDIPEPPAAPPIDTTTTQPENDRLIARADYYLNIALSEPRVIGLVMFLGPSTRHAPMVQRTYYPDGPVVFDSKGVPQFIPETLIGAWDMPQVEAKWRFIGRALGFGPANTTMQPGQQLGANQWAKSPDGRFSLRYNADGRLLLFRWDGAIIWDNGLPHTPGRFIMQGDGNCGIYDVNGNGIWFTWTQANPGAYLKVLNSGSFGIFSAAGALLWQSGPGGY